MDGTSLILRAVPLRRWPHCAATSGPRPAEYVPHLCRACAEYVPRCLQAYGVDYGNYMHQLAAEFGGAPSLRTLALRSPRVLVSCDWLRLEPRYTLTDL